MKILGIETSCDDTCVSVIKDFEILANVVSSQIKVHQKWGGVYPTIARREHQKNLTTVFKKALEKSNLLIKEKSLIEEEKIKEILLKEDVLLKKTITLLKNYKKPDIDFIAVTYGPGLDPSLWSGINFAKALSAEWKIPIIPVNHIEAHLLISLFEIKNNKLKQKSVNFPAIGLIASGGHTQLVLVKSLGKYKTIGETRDDAAGECLDKIARILGLKYPGGPAIAKRAKLCKNNLITLPRPMINHKNYDFSFSGLKTAVLYSKDKDSVNCMAKEAQQAVIDVLLKKTLLASKEYRAQSIILGGGVTANEELRKQFSKQFKCLLLPPKGAQTDNALMIAVAGHISPKTKNYARIKSNPNLRI
ncbi:MAG: tRNA (adenosine(37)-N6)-threonylcarbamoyltransferase complex transferase subunit TsaD [Candidatus Pacebacteria bacterium]|nr:tRNA (adenosine(37)-N6)-threonylcarbamoyltransferase complex transferase subunit TsaD [Candidatus Paceibacterota bacterium]